MGTEFVEGHRKFVSGAGVGGLEHTDRIHIHVDSGVFLALMDECNYSDPIRTTNIARMPASVTASAYAAHPEKEIQNSQRIV